MAEEDDAQKTEEPSQKKLQKARDKGNVATSQEIKSWGMLLTATMGLFIMAPDIMSGVKQTGAVFLQSPHAIEMNVEQLRLVFVRVVLDLVNILSPLIGILVIAALASNVGQIGFLFAPSKIKPEINKISLIKGVKNKFSMRQLVEFVKGLLKLMIVAIVALGLVLPLLGELKLLPSTNLYFTLQRIHLVVTWLFGGTIAVMTAIAILDFMYQKYNHMKQLRMSKQEVKDEHKQSEGDPHVKAMIRKIRTQRARARMMAEVPEADVVITNPTHYAVALKYKMEEMTAPVLVAKGMDSLAFRIREVAEENEIPIVENPPLARALFAAVELDEEIPPEHFKAVAEVIGYVMRLRGEMPSAMAR
ncbi:MAG: flagellar biosynthesis protein FlhB [Rhodospirillales bacterium]|jgi:flagellar biosynthesis protein FlhB|nr:flagellar biosynthesis protein FlhB [Rhodospirillales bacterium]